MESRVFESDDQTIKSNDDQISRMLGLNDRLHLFDENSYIDQSFNGTWPSPTMSQKEETPKNVQNCHKDFSFRARCCDEESAKEDRNYKSADGNLGNSCFKNSHSLEQCQYFRNISNKNRMTQLTSGIRRSSPMYRHWCLLSVSIAFGLGVLLGIFVPFIYLTKDVLTKENNLSKYQSLAFSNYSEHIKLPKYTLNDVIRKVESTNVNLTTHNRVFMPTQSRVDYSNRKKPFFPTIHDVKNKTNLNVNKIRGLSTVKLNKPKIFSSVSFVDGIENYTYEEAKNKQVQYDSESREKLLKYLDLEPTNETQKFFVEFGKKILEKSLEQNTTQNSANESDDDTILHNNIYWGPKIEKLLPSGFGFNNNEQWLSYIKSSSVVKMESGCGRMQNRLVTFDDGNQACVRYRQNTDQIQGELFSFYLAQLLHLPNLAPSVVSIVNLTDSLWQKVATDIGSAQWNSNRPVVMTKYVPNLEAAHIPSVFKPSERHLNKFDIMDIVKKGIDQNEDTAESSGNFLLKKITEGLFVDNDLQSDISGVEEDKKILELIAETLPENEKEVFFVEHVKGNIGDALLDKFVELAQWSDLIVFDYLTANLDRIVNNLYNYQWNINIMDAPAHNLAKKVDSNLLLFLDNESGLLHGYRLLNKYEVYHTLLLDSLCVFRKSTANHIKQLHSSGNVGVLLNKMFRDKNGSGVLDILPPLPEKSVKILNERIARVASQIRTCEEKFGR